MTSETDRQLLVQLARGALVSKVTGTTLPALQPSEVTGRRAGAFVTLHRHSELRGCIGHVDPDEPLGHVISRCAMAAAAADPRFPPVVAAELNEIAIELSILGPLELVTTLEDIEVGRHGLVIESGWNRGLLLPQVATEWRWDRVAFVAQTCRKAGLQADAWRKGATMWRFEAVVFGEAV
jgi:AmmeMemoRadiSam system protein A